MKITPAVTLYFYDKEFVLLETPSSNDSFLQFLSSLGFFVTDNEAYRVMWMHQVWDKMSFIYDGNYVGGLRFTINSAFLNAYYDVKNILENSDGKSKYVSGADVWTNVTYRQENDGTFTINFDLIIYLPWYQEIVRIRSIDGVLRLYRKFSELYNKLYAPHKIRR